MRAYLFNPWETAAFGILLIMGVFTPWAVLAAALFFCGAEIVAGVRRREGPRWWPGAWPRDRAKIDVLYDATCVLCARSKARLQTWPTAGRMRFVALQSPEARELVPGLPEEQFMGAMHVVEEGRVYSGADAWFRIMRLSPLWLAWISWIAPRFLAGPIYAFIARNRYHWFGRTCDSGSCPVE